MKWNNNSNNNKNNNNNNNDDIGQNRSSNQDKLLKLNDIKNFINSEKPQKLKKNN